MMVEFFYFLFFLFVYRLLRGARRRRKMNCRIGRKLGSGTFGKVYEAVDETECSVAVKMMPMSYRSTVFEPEAELLRMATQRQKERRHVVPLRRAFVDNELRKCGMVMDRYGDSLLQVIDRVYEDETPLPFPKYQRIVLQLAEALDFLHKDCDVIHGDIKPENVLFREWTRDCEDWPGDDDGVALIDLGLGCRSQRTDAEMRVQTREYRAPEIIDTRMYSTYDSSIDIWSYGCVAFELATGCILFNTSSRTHVRNRKLASKIRDQRHLLDIVRWTTDLSQHPDLRACPYREFVVKLCGLCFPMSREQRATAKEICEFIETKYNKTEQEINS
jgi:serine/threonine protein kinase